jgi:hypothetical protein
MTFAASLLSSCWEFATRHPGILLVLFGVAGEVIFDWGEMKGRLACAKRLSALVLIAGLILEFSEAAKSDKDVSSAIERAGIAEQKAGEANERAANSELKVEELRKQNAELAIRLQPRRITQQQKNKFIEILKNDPKCPVKVFVGRRDAETYNYAVQMREMLNSAGFGTGEDENIRDWGDFTINVPINVFNEKSMDNPIIIVLFGEPNKPIDWPGLKVTFDTTGHAINTYTGDISGFAIINDALLRIGINATVTSQTNWFATKPGEWGIFVPQKF